MSTNFVKCPVCDHQAEQEIWSSEWGIEEAYITCPVCGYRYQFAYGAHFEEIGNKWFIWGHNTNQNARLKLFKKMKKAMFMARRRWKKYQKGCNAKDCPI